METDALTRLPVDRLFETASSRLTIESFARSGPNLLRLCFARKSLADSFLPSFLPAKAGVADLQIAFLTSTDVDLSELIPQSPNAHNAISFDDWFVAWDPGDQPVLYILDRKSKRALVWFGAGTPPDWIAARPALPIMSAISVDSPWIALHAAAIGRNGRMLLLAGDGHTGKTTAALSCARAGWDYAGDDFIYANATNAKVEPLYCSARLRADMAPAFTDFLVGPTRTSNSDGELRYELSLDGKIGREHLRGGSMAAILLPRRRGAILPEFSPARRFDAFAALKTSMALSMLMLPLSWRKGAIKKVAMVIELAPVFFVDTGRDIAAIPQAFAEFLDRL